MSNNGNFYRVIVGDCIQGTFVYDDVELANIMYDFFIANRTTIDGSKPEVRIEHVTEYGDVYFTKTRPAIDATPAPDDDAAYREYCERNGYNEHGFKVGSF